MAERRQRPRLLPLRARGEGPRPRRGRPRPGAKKAPAKKVSPKRATDGVQPERRPGEAGRARSRAWTRQEPEPEVKGLGIAPGARRPGAPRRPLLRGPAPKPAAPQPEPEANGESAPAPEPSADGQRRSACTSPGEGSGYREGCTSARQALTSVFRYSLDGNETIVDVTTHQVPCHADRPRIRGSARSRSPSKLQDVLYEIRGPVHEHASRLEAEGHRILKLNIGNPAPFGFEAPDVIMRDMIEALPYAQGYSDSKGIQAARRAVFTRYELVDGFPRFDVDDVYLGNGVSELITMTLQALLDNGDQVLIPAPDYPLWTASTSLAGGTPVHYLCDETQGWQPDIADLESKITDRTKALVVINPNNPTGAVYGTRGPRADGRTGAQAPAAAARRRDLRQDPLRRRRAHQPGDAGAGSAVADVQRLVQGLPGGRLPLGLAGDHRPQGTRGQLPGGHQPAGQHAAVPECARAARHSGRARRPSEHRRSGAARADDCSSSAMSRGRSSTRSPGCRA